MTIVLHVPLHLRVWHCSAFISYSSGLRYGIKYKTIGDDSWRVFRTLVHSENVFVILVVWRATYMYNYTVMRMNTCVCKHTWEHCMLITSCHSNEVNNCNSYVGIKFMEMWPLCEDWRGSRTVSLTVRSQRTNAGKVTVTVRRQKVSALLQRKLWRFM